MWARPLSLPWQGIVTIGAVDCDVDGNKQLCSKYGVQGFPTLKVFPADKQKNVKTGTVSKSPSDYNGEVRQKNAACSFRPALHLSCQLLVVGECPFACAY